MSLILSIDTAVVEASICLADDARIIRLEKNTVQGESAAWLHTTIEQLLQEEGVALTQLAAIAVSSGPGSYTGLRVGMASAKGLCYVLKIPLILVNTLRMMAAAAVNEPTALLCPMIDARRLEVFTGLYTTALVEMMPAHALVLQSDSFLNVLERDSITFFGNGSSKFQALLQHPNAVFKHIEAGAAQVAFLAHQAFIKKEFADLAYSEPFYGKEFFSPAAKQ